MHGGNPLRVNGTVLLPDGAMTDEFDTVRHDPPADPYARLKRRRIYAAEALRRTESDFKRIKNALMGYGTVHASSLYTRGLPADGVQALERLKGVADEQRASLSAIDAEIEAAPEAKARRERESNDRQHRADAASQEAALHARVKAINL